MVTFTNDLERSIDILSKENKKCIICGDININRLKIEKDDNVSSFFNTMLSNNYIPNITLPTHITDHNISLIDHILLKESNMICHKITAGNIYNNITDHLPNFIFMKMHRKNSHRIGERPMIRLYSGNNISTFKTLLSRSDTKSVFKCQDANIAHVEFMKIYDQSFNEALTFGRLSKKEQKIKKIKLFSVGLKKSNKGNCNFTKKSQSTNFQ